MTTPMAMSKPTPTSSMTGTPTKPSMSMTSMAASSPPVYNAASGSVSSNMGTVLGALMAAVGLFAI